MPSRPAVAQTSPDSDAPVAPSTDTAIGTQGAAKNAIGGIAHFNQFAIQNLSGAQAAKWTVAVVGCSAVLAVLMSYSIRLLIFVLIWSGIAFAAKSRRLSNVIAIAGGLLGSMILTAFVLYFLQSAGMLQPPGQSNLASISAPSPIAPAVAPSPNKDLDNAALGILQDSEVGLAGLCDKIYDQSLHQVVYGTIAAGSTRLPAIKAQYEFMCVNPVDGSREQKSSFWVVLGNDTLSDKYRCVKVAGKDVVDEVAAQCDFKS
jgi:hypothetical protein